VHGTQQLILVERFKKEISSAALHCSGVQRIVIPRCNNDTRDLGESSFKMV
jgi:hypothetical protein